MFNTRRVSRQERLWANQSRTPEVQKMKSRSSREGVNFFLTLVAQDSKGFK